MSALRGAIERVVGRLKRDPDYHIVGGYTDAQLAVVVWYRALQFLRALPLLLRARHATWPVFRGRRVVVEHAGGLRAGPSLILEDEVHLHALGLNGIVLGRNVTIARGATLVCSGVLAQPGVGIVIGDRSAIGAGSFLGGQGGITVGDDVIMGPGVRIFSENHRYDDLARPIRTQGVERAAVTVDNDCWIGAGATLLAGVTIGRGCVIAAGAVVTGDLPPLSVAAGVPARVIRMRGP